MLLHLVRHGPSSQDPSEPAANWVLTDRAHIEIGKLKASGVLPVKAAWFASPEQKAADTANLLARSEVTLLADLREAERAAGWVVDFDAMVRASFRYLEVSAMPGWEPLQQTRRRVRAAVEATVRALDTRSTEIVMVGHGTAWTLLVAELTEHPPDLDTWSRMTMPDHCCIDLAQGRLVSGWGDWQRGDGPGTAG